jgi:hypothetical protein
MSAGKITGAAEEGPLNDVIRVRGAIPFWDPSPSGDLTSVFQLDGPVDVNGRPVFNGDGPLYSENAWDRVTLNGNEIPGICAVKCESKLQIDQQKGPKHDGALLVVQGVLPSPIDISVTIWTEQQWGTFVELIPLIWRKPNKSGDINSIAKTLRLSQAAAAQALLAVDIIHPACQMFGINYVIVSGMSQPEDGPVPQSKVIRIKCVQYLPPSRKTIPSKPHARPIDVPVDPRIVTPAVEPPSKTGVGPSH